MAAERAMAGKKGKYIYWFARVRTIVIQYESVNEGINYIQMTKHREQI